MCHFVRPRTYACPTATLEICFCMYFYFEVLQKYQKKTSDQGFKDLHRSFTFSHFKTAAPSGTAGRFHRHALVKSRPGRHYCSSVTITHLPCYYYYLPLFTLHVPSDCMRNAFLLPLCSSTLKISRYHRISQKLWRRQIALFIASSRGRPHHTHPPTFLRRRLSSQTREEQLVDDKKASTACLCWNTHTPAHKKTTAKQ